MNFNTPSVMHSVANNHDFSSNQANAARLNLSHNSAYPMQSNGHFYHQSKTTPIRFNTAAEHDNSSFKLHQLYGLVSVYCSFTSEYLRNVNIRIYQIFL